jgi:hypothetical protein
MKNIGILVLGLLLLAAPAALSCEHNHPKEVFDYFAMLHKFPHHKDGTIIIPPWLREDESQPEAFFQFDEDGRQLTTEPLLRRI